MIHGIATNPTAKTPFFPACRLQISCALWLHLTQTRLLDFEKETILPSWKFWEGRSSLPPRQKPLPQSRCWGLRASKGLEARRVLEISGPYGWSRRDADAGSPKGVRRRKDRYLPSRFANESLSKLQSLGLELYGFRSDCFDANSFIKDANGFMNSLALLWLMINVEKIRLIFLVFLSLFRFSSLTTLIDVH